MKEQIINGIKYRLNEETLTAAVTCLLAGDSIEDYAGDINIPKIVMFDGVPYCVTSIDCEAFTDCKSLTSITIPDSVKVIANMAFYRCSSLTEITIPNSVKSLGHNAFSNCISLEAITYNGTRDKWKKVKKDTLSDKWITGILAKFVQCTDGLVKI